MPRALWKGAISFGLVHIPVALYPAARENRIDFDWLDKRDMKPVGYKRVNKATGKEVTKEDIVKGVEVEDGQYVVLDDEEIKAALPQTTQTVEILAFVEEGSIDAAFFDRPYVLAPTARGDKVYVLLREALRKSGRIAVARVVIQTKQHLAVLMPREDAMVLNTLRWADELRTLEDIELPAATAKNKPSERELKMAQQLIDELSAKWDPAQYEDHFRHAIQQLLDAKRKQGDVKEVQPLEHVPEGGGAEVIDLAELLKRSLQGKGGAAKSAPTAREAANDARSSRKSEPKPARERAAAKAEPAPKKVAAKRSATRKPAAAKRAKAA